LHAKLQEPGAIRLLLTGVATSGGVESTARAAREHGYQVVLVTDATTDLDAGAHRNSVERIFPELGETATTAEILKLVDRPRPANVQAGSGPAALTMAERSGLRWSVRRG
jgi:nicotinamidase-related amidase